MVTLEIPGARSGSVDARICHSVLGMTVSHDQRSLVLPVIVSETVGPMRALMQNGDDADRAIVQHFPIDKMFLVAADEALHAKGGRNRAPRNAPRGDRLETFEEAAQGMLSLSDTMQRTDRRFSRLAWPRT
jgi:hypothetical protein